MKKLTRVKLINWHRFTNVTMEMDDSVLISGENGAGKSTFLDAIQFVVNCSANYFNKAARPVLPDFAGCSAFFPVVLLFLPSLL
ncbi:hypothetical protein IMSAG025_02271 [Muribaculaceae bacterium]|nr:hypothetical protein IMSAG025_02271 [Muribaculaceae bacterium]